VELAQLKYTLPRLVGKNSFMSRLMGGGTGGRGPGETKLETDRRRVRERIDRLEKQIDQIAAQRAIQRQKRKDCRVPVVSIVGYTNAGKSTLLHALTGADVLMEDKLFATLDPRTRRVRYPDEAEIIFTDTVGFIEDLPPDLVRAFRATLEELEQADLLLHLVDASDPGNDFKRLQVEAILDEMKLAHIPRFTVYNKSDRMPVLPAAEPRDLYVSSVSPPTLVPLVDRILTFFKKKRTRFAPKRTRQTRPRRAPAPAAPDCAAPE
jgi:GTP-binding protein HflX